MKKLLQISVNACPMAVRHWIKHIPGVAALQRWLIRTTLSGEPFVHQINAGPARGLRFEVTLPLDKAIWAGTFEPEFSKILVESVRPGDVCYDIGGYRGYMSGVFALAGAGKVIIFEPLSANIRALKRLIELNPGLPLELMEKAVGNRDGEVSFKIMGDASMGKLSASSFQADVAASREITVDINCLDTLVFAQKLPPPNVIKIDVEGAEVDVLDGAVRTLREYRPRLLVEAHSESFAEQCAQRLRALGYNLRQMEKPPLRPDEYRHLIAEPASA